MASIPGDSKDGGGRAAPGAVAEAQGAAPGTTSPIPSPVTDLTDPKAEVRALA